MPRPTPPAPPDIAPATTAAPMIMASSAEMDRAAAALAAPENPTGFWRHFHAPHAFLGREFTGR